MLVHLAALFAAANLTGLVAPSLYPGATTATLAGTGHAGNDDGLALKATFMLPTVVRYAADGTLYILDTAGQRVRAYKDGTVSTVAGGGTVTPDGLAVIGGYADGATGEARFNNPTGMAIGPDGAVYVADTDNHCIRRIANGHVSTFVGKQTIIGHQDGDRSKVTFTSPMGMTFDSNGNLWVADNGAGIRKIRRDGHTFTLRLPANFGSAFTDVSLYESGGSMNVFAAAEYGMLTFNYQTRKPDLVAGVYEGSTAIHPYGLTAVSADEVLSADPGWNVVRYVRLAQPPALVYGFSRVVAGGQSHRPDLNGGFRDGLPVESLFAAPTTVALQPNGDITVADAGNRKIRTVPAIDRRRAFNEPVPPQVDHSYFTIAYVANSYAFWNSMWDDSIPGIIERTLNDNRAALGITKPVRVIAARFDGSGVTAKMQFIREALADTGPDMVIWSFNGFDLGAEQQAQIAKHLSIEQTADYLSDSLRDLRRYLNAKGIAFFVGAQPIGISFSPTEATVSKLVAPSWRPFDQVGIYIEGLIEKAVKKSGVPAELSLEALDAYEKGDRLVPLYESTEGGYHFTPAGNAFYGDLLAHALTEQKPWASVAGEVVPPAGK